MKSFSKINMEAGVSFSCRFHCSIMINLEYDPYNSCWKRILCLHWQRHLWTGGKKSWRTFGSFIKWLLRSQFSGNNRSLKGRITRTALWSLLQLKRDVAGSEEAWAGFLSGSLPLGLLLFGWFCDFPLVAGFLAEGGAQEMAEHQRRQLGVQRRWRRRWWGRSHDYDESLLFLLLLVLKTSLFLVKGGSFSRREFWLRGGRRKEGKRLGEDKW